jgi:hypothetical protein
VFARPRIHIVPALTKTTRQDKVCPSIRRAPGPISVRSRRSAGQRAGQAPSGEQSHGHGRPAAAAHYHHSSPHAVRSMPKHPGVSRPASPDADDVGLRAPPNDLLPERCGDALRPAEPGSGEEVTASPLVGFLEGRASRGSGRLSVLDLAAADLADAEDSRLQNESTQSCALCAWAGNAVVYGAGCAAIWYALFWLYFHETISDEGMCDSAAQMQTRATIHWLVGLLPTLGRTVLFGVAMFVASVLCQKAGLVPEGTGRSLAPVLLLGAGPTDGSAKSAGWLAIVGDERRTQQTTWEQAMQARGLTAPQAWTVASVKLLFWHWSQPLAYLLLLMSYRCYIAELGPTQPAMRASISFLSRSATPSLPSGFCCSLGPSRDCQALQGCSTLSDTWRCGSRRA